MATQPDLLKFRDDPKAFRESLVMPFGGEQRRLGDVLQPFQQEALAELDKALLAVQAGRKPEIGRHYWCWSKGAGKDTLISCGLLYLIAFTSRTIVIECGAGDKEQAQGMMGVIREILRYNPWLHDLVEVQVYNLVNLHTESRLTIVSSEHKTIHGSRPAVIWANETTCLSDGDAGLGFYSAMMANALKTGALCIVTSNAGIVGSWQHKVYEAACSSLQWFTHTHGQPATWISEADLAELERVTPKSLMQRWFYSIWTVGSGDGLPENEVTAAVTLSGPQPKEKGWRYFGGIDLSSSHDASALAITARRGFEYKLCYLRSWVPTHGKRVVLSSVQTNVMEKHDEYSLTRLGYDPYQSELMAEQLERSGIRCERMAFTGALINELSVHVLDLLSSGALAIYPHAQLMQDLARVRIVARAYGLKIEAARTASQGHGDCFTALAISLLTAKRHGNARGSGEDLWCSNGESEYVPQHYEPTSDQRFRMQQIGDQVAARLMGR